MCPNNLRTYIFAIKFTSNDSFSFVIQASVPDWLMLLNLTQYEQVLMDAGYDDIDFVADITTEELQDIGITKKGTVIREYFVAK